MEGTTDTKYRRVVPRDLFNEAKLLKCLGQLALLVHEGKVPGLTTANFGGAFEVGLHSAGYMRVKAGVQFLYRSRQTKLAEVLWVGTVVNSRNDWPLFCYTEDEEELAVFDELGQPTEEFLEYVAG